MTRPRVPLLLAYSLGYFVILEAMLAAAILYWPEFEQKSGAIRILMSSFPVAGELLDLIEQAGVYGYVAGQHFFKGCNTLGSAGAILFAAGAIAGEAHRGTLEILLARPLSRRRILLERYLAGLAAFALPVFATSLTIPALCAVVGERISYVSVTLGAVHQVVFLSVIHGLTFLLSTRGSNPIKIALVVIFGTLFSFALYFVKYVSSFSPFRLVDFVDFIDIDRTHRLDWWVVGPLLALTAVLHVLAQRSFRGRCP